MVLIIHYIIIVSALGYQINVGNIILTAFGILFIIIGNYLPRLKQNAIAGIRLPWTLKDEDTWRVTHRTGGYCTLVMGILLVLLSFIIPNRYAIPAMLMVLVTWGVGLFIYSYVYHKRKFGKG